MIHRPLAQTKALRAREALSACRLCARQCGASRQHLPGGFCGAQAEGKVFYEQLEGAGEQELVPTYAVGLSGCNFRCAFCVTGICSQDAGAGRPIELTAIGRRMAAAAESVRSVTLLGGEPAIHLPTALELAALVPAQLLLVWKSNAYAAPDTLAALENVVDIFLADYKFGNAECARRLAAVENYAPVVEANLRWAKAHTRLIVRHLLMPGHLECCFLPVAEWLAREMPDVPLSLMTGFLPLFEAHKHPELMRTLRADEVLWARKQALERGLTLAPWLLAPNEAAGAKGGQSEIWIDRQGRVCAPSLSAEMAACLQRLDIKLRP